MPRQTRSSKRALGESEGDAEVTELQRAVKRLNTGGARGAAPDAPSANPTATSTAASSEGGAAAAAASKRAGEEDAARRRDEGEAAVTGANEYAEINAMLRTLHFARVRRRESLSAPPPRDPG